MARIPALPEQDASAEIQATYERVRVKYGQLLEPVTVVANHPEMFKAYMGFERCLQEAKRIDSNLKTLAELKVAMLIGCPFCVDFGSALARRAGITDAQIRAMISHSESDVFSSVEKLVLDYAVAMTQSPVEVSDSLFNKLRELFDTAQMVEITAIISWENYRSRFNHALGIQSHGFSDQRYCSPPQIS